MFRTLRKTATLIDSGERWQLLLLLVLVVFNGMAQVAGVGSVMPFIGVLTRPELVQENLLLRWAHGQIGAPSINTFLAFLGAAVLFAFVVSNILLALTQWYTFKFSRRNQYGLSLRLFHAYIKRPYVYHLQHNSADVSKNILTETQNFTQQVLIAGLQAVAFGVSALFIASFLVWLNPLVAAIAIGVIGGAYGLIYLTLRRQLRRVGRTRLRANTGRFKAANEAFGAVKELKAAGKESVFIDRYAPEAKRFAEAIAAQQIMRNLPRYLVEIVGMGSVLLVVVLLVAFGYEIAVLAPLVGVYVVAGQRLFPAFQHIYNGLAGIRTNTLMVEALHKELAAAAEDGADRSPSRRQNGLEKLTFRNAIELEGVTFTYPGADYPALDAVTLSVPCGAAVAFVGETGAGKTTLADVIIGLLQPQKGAVYVDGVALTDRNLPSWRANLGYVPQHIYLLDDMIERNIAFGVPDAQIDRGAVERAAKIANIHEFVVNDLPDGYRTIVGERGIRLSGGQRQRIGIARALYHDPELLVLDEATSALDNATEEAVQKAIDQAAEAKTLILIAHRLSTVRDCDLVYVLKKGRLVAEGTYDTLLDGSPQFQALVRSRDNSRTTIAVQER